MPSHWLQPAPRLGERVTFSLRRIAGAVAAIAVLAIGSSCVSRPPRTLSAVEPVRLDSADFVTFQHELAVGDLIGVEFPYSPSLSREVLIRTDGRVTLPFIGAITAVRRTPEELEAELRERYAAIAYDPFKSDGGTRDYLISVGDRLELKFRDARDLDDTVRVRPDGKISLALVKTLVAEGKTPEALEAELVRAYAAHLKDPQLVLIVRSYSSERSYANGRLVRPGARDLDALTVIVKSFAARQVFVAGEVKNPGTLAYQPPMTAMQALLGAGGPLRSGDLSRVLVLRKVGVTDPMAMVVNLVGEVRGGSSTNDLPLRQYDIVIVPATRAARVAQAIDQYAYQIIPALRNVNFSFFLDLGRRSR